MPKPPARSCVSCGVLLQFHPVPKTDTWLPIPGCSGCARDEDVAFFRAHLEGLKANA